MHVDLQGLMIGYNVKRGTNCWWQNLNVLFCFQQEQYCNAEHHCLIDAFGSLRLSVTLEMKGQSILSWTQIWYIFCEQEFPLVLTLGNPWYSATPTSCHSSKTFVMQMCPYTLTFNVQTFKCPVLPCHSCPMPDLVVGPTVSLFGFPSQVNTVSTEIFHACTALQML
jgi:hypothetical protein